MAHVLVTPRERELQHCDLPDWSRRNVRDPGQYAKPLFPNTSPGLRYSKVECDDLQMQLSVALFDLSLFRGMLTASTVVQCEKAAACLVIQPLRSSEELCVTGVQQHVMVI